MGQYYYVVNIDKREFLHPHQFNDGLKLMEFGQSGGGTLLALTVLLADGNGRGGGDIHTKDREWVGRWAGDRIVIAGDYADPDKYGVEGTLYGACGTDAWRNISEPVRAVLIAAGEYPPAPAEVRP